MEAGVLKKTIIAIIAVGLLASGQPAREHGIHVFSYQTQSPVTIAIVSSGIKTQVRTRSQPQVRVVARLPTRGQVVVRRGPYWRILVVLPREAKATPQDFVRVILPRRSSPTLTVTGEPLAVYGWYNHVEITASGTPLVGTLISTSTIIRASGGPVTLKYRQPSNTVRIDSNGSPVSISGVWARATTIKSDGGPVSVLGVPWTRTLIHVHDTGGTFSTSYPGLKMKDGTVTGAIGKKARHPVALNIADTGGPVFVGHLSH